MKSIIAFSLIFSFLFSSSVYSFNKKGYIQNHNGEQCWYTQKTVPGKWYFSSSLTSSTQKLLKFDDPNCMNYDQGNLELTLNVNAFMINNILKRWYSHSDANFQTRAGDLIHSKDMKFQEVGYCIKSKKYPMAGISVAYISNDSAIVEVMHSSSVGGCM